MMASMILTTAAAIVTLCLPGMSGEAVIDAGRGPVAVQIPADYDESNPAPIIMLLHGYMNSGADIEAWMQFGPIVDEFGFLLLAPDGTVDCLGQPFWNATDGCCNFCGSGVDDSGYLRALIEELREQFVVDDNRIYLVGHSNGGFMAHRMACDHAETVAAIASLAGATFLDASDCMASEPVHVLQLHGTADPVIDYNGGCIFGAGCYPGAVETCVQWAGTNGCQLAGEPDATPINIDAGIPGAETSVTRWTDGCASGGSAELWTIQGGAHSPPLVSDFSRVIVEYLYAHPKRSACGADLDGNGDVGVVDLVELITAWGPCPGCPADLDQDGDVGVSDLVELVLAWGPCN
jgi:polyhydroxybutyrate depolymerase